ncbi:STAS domain-containing protein [Brochothrix thermosphacta]|uniref:STAS domain-containing protein n=1 Tax=Brochothrix thermosphacta TaxID=2756 RepID=UPI0039B05141
MVLNTSVEETNDNTAIFTLRGEIDGNTAPRLEIEMSKFAEIENFVIRVNLSEVTYMDSTGLGVFVGIYKSLFKVNGQLLIEEVPKRLYRLFTITGLDNIMSINRKEKDDGADDN